MYVLGIDLGTSGCKACAVDAAGRVAAEGSVGYPTSSPQPGWAEQDPADWIGAVVEAVGKLTESGAVAPTDVAGLALSCAAHIGVLLDEHDQPLRPAILWSDQRSHQEVAELERECGDEVFQLTHQRVSTTWTLPHLVWVRRHEPGVWSQVRRVLLSKDYLLWWLMGRRVTDPATAVSAQLYDARAGQWSERLCGLAELTTDMLPQIVPPTDVAGTLTDAVAKKLGLPPATPVVVGTLDSAAETYGAGVDQPGQCLLRVATAGGAHLVLPEPHPHPRLITYPHPRQPLWYSQAGTSSCASAVRWAIDCFQQRWNSVVRGLGPAGRQRPGGLRGTAVPPLPGRRTLSLLEPRPEGQLRRRYSGPRHGALRPSGVRRDGLFYSRRAVSTGGVGHRSRSVRGGRRGDGQRDLDADPGRCAGPSARHRARGRLVLRRSAARTGGAGTVG